MKTQIIDCQNMGYSGLTGKKLKDKYTLGKCIDSGNFGEIFEIEGGLVAKVSEDSESLANEIKIIKTLAKNRARYVTTLIDYDIVVINNFQNDKRTTCGYLIMPKYLRTHSCPLHTGRQLLRSLEFLHNIGRVHNDIKPENVMSSKNGSTVLIDFGMSEKYTDQDQDSVFQGNLLFASLDKLNFKKTTRKDDLVSLAYMMMFLTCNHEMPYSQEFMKNEDNSCNDPRANLDLIKRYKEKHSLKEMAKKT